MIKSYSKFLLIIFFLTFCSCNSKNSNTKQEKAHDLPLVQKDSTLKDIPCDFPDDFHRFQKSIIDGNINESGNYLDFPFKSENIWHLVFLNSSEEESYNPKIDFTLEDFQKYFDDLFPYGFKELLKEVKSDMLLKSGRFSSATKSSKDANGNINETYSMVTTYSEHDGKLIFSLFIEFHEEEETYETQIVYEFDYTDCKIKLENIYLAG